MSIFENDLRQHQALFSKLDALAPVIDCAEKVVADVMLKGGKLMLCGNGGSAADSQHIAAEFTGRFVNDRRPLPAMALSTDTSALTCIGNDYAFDQVFRRQVMALGKPGDCLMGISTSGNSQNIIEAVRCCKGMGIMSVGLLGRDGGVLSGLCDLSIIVPFDITSRIQEAHILIGHSLCGGIERQLALAGFLKGDGDML